MIFNAITIFPKMFDAIINEGIIARAITKNIITINTLQLRDFTDNKYKNVDDTPFGGGGGMVMQVAPIRKCIASIKRTQPHTKVIYLSPQGRKLDAALAQQLSQEKSLTLLCGRYEGVDERVIARDVDMEVSIGDFVVSGGELPAMLLIDAISRQIDGVLGNKNSLNDSFQNGLLDYPHYTKPREIDGQKVPKVLLSGHDAKIAEWRKQQAILATQTKRNC
jgi:tRNA (guanine37-N1)-methyltransferase